MAKVGVACQAIVEISDLRLSAPTARIETVRFFHLLESICTFGSVEVTVNVSPVGTVTVIS